MADLGSSDGWVGGGLTGQCANQAAPRPRATPKPTYETPPSQPPPPVSGSPLPFPVFVQHRYTPTVRPFLAPAWRKTVDFQLARLCEAFPGPLDAITPEATLRWWASLREAGHSPAYCNKFLVRLRGVMRRAVQWGALAHDPTQGLSKLTEHPDKDKWFTPEEWVALLALARPTLRAWMLVGYYTGARRATIAALRERHVHWGAKTITLPRPKGGDDLVLPLAHPLEAFLLPRRTGNPEAPLVPQVRHDSISRAFQRLAARAFKKGLIRRPLPFHAIRHTTGTHLALAGAPQAVVRDYLGHADLRMSSRYTHASVGALTAAAAHLT